jgi:hypothetical protein
MAILIWVQLHVRQEDEIAIIEPHPVIGTFVNRYRS